MKRKLWLCLTLLVLLSTFIFADIVSVHNQALNEYHKMKDLSKVIEMMEEGGIKDILKAKPEDISKRTYINILNDYAYFLSETDDRYEEAIPVLERVIKISPERAVVYLNLGDVYARLDKNKYDFDILKNYMEYYLLLKKDAKMPVRVQSVINTLDGMSLKDKSKNQRNEIMNWVFRKLIREMKYGDYYFTTSFMEYSENLKNLSEAEKNQWAEKLWESLINMKDIEFINPIYETDDIDDPNLKKYSDKFDLEFWSATYGGLNFEREKREKSLSKFSFNNFKYAKHNFKVYEEDVTSLVKGKETIVYSGGYGYNSDLSKSSGKISLFNENYNDEYDGLFGKGYLADMHMRDEYASEELVLTNSYVGLFKYKNTIYFYNIKSIKDDYARTFVIYEYDHKKKILGGVITYSKK